MQKFTFLVFIAFSTIFSSCKNSAVLFSKGSTTKTPFDKTVPFTKNLGLMIVPVEIEGETYQFLFDTGAPMVISEELQEKLQGKKLAMKGVGDSQGRKKQLAYVRMPAMKVAGQSFEKLTAIVADLEASPVIGCLKIDGIIGANMMRLAFWEIDYEADLMHFTNVWENLKIDSNANHFNFYVQATGTPVIPELFLDSVRIINVTFDTGSSGILGVAQSNLPGMKSDSSLISAYGHLNSGLYGSTIDTVYYVQKSFVLGQDTILNFPFEIQTERSKKLLGMRYFRNYRMILNWDEKSVYMHKNPNADFNELKSFGISFILENNHLLVGSLRSGSLVENAGISLGDTVLRVNQISSPLIDPDDFCQLLIELKDGNSVEIEINEKGVFNLKKESIYRHVRSD